MTIRDFAKRVQFNEENQIMEVDFSDLAFDDNEQVNAFYDMVDQQIAQTGRNWFFLVNYKNCKIDPKAWVAFAHRGKRVNIQHSLGSVRYSAREAEKNVIENRSKSESFDANLFESREAAMAQLVQMGAGDAKH